MRHLDSQRCVLSSKKGGGGADPPPENSSEESNHEVSVQGPSNGTYRIGLGFEHIKVNAQNLFIFNFIKCSLIILCYI
jgi:hypothetical protein